MATLPFCNIIEEWLFRTGSTSIILPLCHFIWTPSILLVSTSMYLSFLSKETNIIYTCSQTDRLKCYRTLMRRFSLYRRKYKWRPKLMPMQETGFESNEVIGNKEPLVIIHCSLLVQRSSFFSSLQRDSSETFLLGKLVEHRAQSMSRSVTKWWQQSRLT